MKMIWRSHNDFQELLNLVGSDTCEITIKPLKDDKLRTGLQNKAIHKDISNTAQILNENNISAKDLFSCARNEIGVTDKLVKEFWHFVIEEGFNLEPSTSKLTTAQVSEVRTVIERAISKRLGVDIGPFPSSR